VNTSPLPASVGAVLHSRAPADDAPLLAVQDLVVEFTQEGRALRAVDGVSLEIARGEVLAVVGESGCGKSVTALAVMRLLREPPARVQGSVLLGGRDLLRLPEGAMRTIRGARIAMVFQDPLSSLNPVLTVGSQVAEAIALHQRVPRREAWNRAVEMLDRVRLPDPAARARAYPHQLSGGQRQRVMIAMAFACNPELVIADEPTTALDVTVQRQILQLMLELRRERGTAIMLITHDLGVVAETADRVAVLYAGRLLEQAPVATLFADPRHPYTRALLSTLPRLDEPLRTRLNAIPGQPPDLVSVPPGCPFAPRCPEVHAACEQMPGWTSILPGRHGVRCWATSARGGPRHGEGGSTSPSPASASESH
jgi:oligopeptide/dipeptide ABC transporter ATP-binding protein